MTTWQNDSRSEQGREIWILRADERQCAALVRLSGLSGPRIHSGSPRDGHFNATRAARSVALIVLGVSGDPEVELEYAHRNARHLPGARWIVVSDDHSDAQLASLFDALDASFIGPPVQGQRLRGAIARALETPEGRDSLRLRDYRDALSERFARWFGDLDLPELLRAMDPQLARVPMLVRGEPGSGRALLARYVHTFGGDAAGGQMPFVEMLCGAATVEADLLRGIESSAGARHATFFLKNLHELRPDVALELRNWIEFGLPPGTRCAANVRWVAGLCPGAAPNVDASLIAVLSGLEVRIPPLRARRSAIEPFARATALAQSEPQRRRVRDFSADAIAALEQYDWPGNLRELESVVRRALADSGADPLEARHLAIPTPRDTEPSAELWEASSREELPLAKVIAAEDEHDPTDAPIRLRVSDLIGDEEDGDDLEALVEWIRDDEGEGEEAESGGALSVRWTPASPTAPADGLVDIEVLSVDSLDDLPALEVRPFARSGAETARAASPHGAPQTAFASVPKGGSDAKAALWQGALSLICEELQRPIESMRPLAEVFEASGIPANYPDAFAHAIAHNIERAREMSRRLDALGPSSTGAPGSPATAAANSSTDASNLLEGLLAELRRSISKRGLLVLKELDRAHPAAVVPAGALRFALRGLLTRFVAREAAAPGSDLYIASHFNAAGLHGLPSLRILLRHAFPAGEAPSAESTESELGIELAVCDAVARSAGGSLSIREPDTRQIVVAIDLPAPPPAAR